MITHCCHDRLSRLTIINITIIPGATISVKKSNGSLNVLYIIMHIYCINALYVCTVCMYVLYVLYVM